ncbi:MAG TPA: T9SS type A sorting domain-containing protein, partial [Flavipsychrobacter sp.]|nr:T9SS type A sorting domain-containing protein [Flavipsychrobacter sp.]
MKKLLLFFFVSLFPLFSLAQNALHSPVIFSKNSLENKLPIYRIQPSSIDNSQRNFNLAERLGKVPVGGGRWYSHFFDIDIFNGEAWTGPNPTQIFFTPMWFDSTVLQRYSNGISANELSSVAEYIDPAAYFQYNNPNNPLVDSNLIQVTRSNDYIVDSVRILAGYIYMPGRPSSVVDTLIISVQPQKFVNYYPQSAAPWINQNPGVTDTAMYVFIPSVTDSTQRCALPDTASIHGGVIWKELLHPLIDADTFLKYFTFAVPGGGAHIPAGMRYAVSFTFKSGDTWKANVDSIEEFNRFMPVWGYEYNPPSWMTYWYGNREGPTFPPADTTWHDANGSSIMDSRNVGLQTFYFATIADQAFQNSLNPSDGRFPEQYLWVLSHITCPTCYSIAQIDAGALGVPNVANNVKVNAYPNPANDIVYIPFTLGSAANVTITLANAVGQVVRTQNMGSTATGKAVFNTSDLPGGVYI